MTNLCVPSVTMRLIAGVQKCTHVFGLQVCTCMSANSLSISVPVWMSQCSTVWALFDEFGIGSRWFVDLSLYINRAASSRSAVSELAVRGGEKVRGIRAALRYRTVHTILSTLCIRFIVTYQIVKNNDLQWLVLCDKNVKNSFLVS